jgi:hypothetical protein
MSGLAAAEAIVLEVARFMCLRAKGPAIYQAQPNGLGVRCNQ